MREGRRLPYHAGDGGEVVGDDTGLVEDDRVNLGKGVMTHMVVKGRNNDDFCLV